MKTINLAGMEYRCHSPSLFELVTPGEPGAAWIACQGPARWIISIRGCWASKTFPTRMDAALLIARAFEQARADAL